MKDDVTASQHGCSLAAAGKSREVCDVSVEEIAHALWETDPTTISTPWWAADDDVRENVKLRALSVVHKIRARLQPAAAASREVERIEGSLFGVEYVVGPDEYARKPGSYVTIYVDEPYEAHWELGARRVVIERALVALPAAAAEPPCGAGVSTNPSAAPPAQMEAAGQQLVARIKRSSKYYGQTPPNAWFDVVVCGDRSYRLRGNSNNYRISDVVFGIRLDGGEIVELK